MSGSQLLLLGGTPQVVSDPNFEYTTLLLPGNGTNGAQNNTFLDSSTNNFTITRNGNTTQGTFSPFSQTGWGNYFDGNGDFLSLASNAAFAPGTGDFTFEAWINPASLSAAVVPVFIVSTTGGLWIGKNGSNFVVRAFGVADQLQVATLPSTNQWTHIAVTRSGTTLRMFYNGILVGSTTNSYNFTQGNLYIGNDGGSDYYTGYISNLRLVKGTAVYTADFTPSTTPLTAITNTSLLTCQSNRFIDNSTNAFAITRNGDVSVQAFSPFNPTAAWSAATNGGSGYFDGSGDFLQVADAAPMELGSGNWTIEMWVNTLNNTQYSALFTRDDGGTTAGSYVILLNTTSANGIVTFFSADVNSFTGAVLSSGTTSCRDGAWHHIAVVRNSNTLTMYIDGTSTSTATFSGSFANTAQPIKIGSETGYSRDYTGYISNVRLVVGTAVYTANFTPPTAPLTAITNTQLLLNNTNAGIYDATSKNDLETVGNAQISTAQSKFGGSSMAFDGSGDALVAPNSRFYDFSSGDFTVEFWFRTNTLTPSSPSGGTAGYACILGQQNWNGASGNGWGVWQFNQTIGFFTPAGTLAQVSTGNVITSTSTWYHIAVVRSGTGANNTKIYIDGVQQGQGTPTITFSTRQLTVGGTRSTYGWDQEYSTNGFINDVRITRYARYTSNFTPPTTAFPLL